MALFASPENVTVLDSLPFECSENRYHCGKEFKTDSLKGGVDTGLKVGLCVIERGRAALGLLKGGRVRTISTEESQVMGKSRSGGQSAQRFARVREKQKEQFFSKVADRLEVIAREHEADACVIGGTLSSAKEFEPFLWHDVNLLGTYSVDHAEEESLEELVRRASERICSEEGAKDRDLVQTFLQSIRDGSAAYGRDPVRTKLERGGVDTLILSTNLKTEEIKNLSERAQQYGSAVRVIDPTFEQAEMFENISNGYGALLRW